jgi:hypothetical protein
MERKRKRAAAGGESTAAMSKWRTRPQHEIYSSKLLEALRLVRAGSSSPSSSAAAPAAAAPRSRAVREAADRALAVAARGRTCWSRAILANSRRRLQAARRARLRNPASPASRHAPAPAAASPAASSPQGGRAKTPPLARKAKELGRVVPGCRKLPFPALLAEVSDYIAALEMQVRAMTALAEALSAVPPSSSEGGSGSSSPPA